MLITRMISLQPIRSQCRYMSFFKHQHPAQHGNNERQLQLETNLETFSLIISVSFAMNIGMHQKPLHPTFWRDNADFEVSC